MRLSLVLLPAVALLILTAAGAAAAPKTDLHIVSGENRHSFRLEVAKTPQEIERGLMFRTRLPENGGMLFDFGKQRPVSMWMLNTLIPLDMLFVAADGSIVKIAPRRRPRSRRTISSGGPVRAVIELAGGTAERLGIKVGDRVVHAIFRDGGG